MDRSLSVLLRAHFTRLPSPVAQGETAVARTTLATVANNLVSYGYGLSRDGFDALVRASEGSVRAWWGELEPVLKSVTGADRKMEAFVVYKNFPAEVLAMSEADYWLRQVLMYFGLPNEWFAQGALPRPEKTEPLALRVLQPAKPDTLREVFRALTLQPTRWTDAQRDDAEHLARVFRGGCDLSAVAFKENMVQLALVCRAQGLSVSVDTATDVLRLAVGMSAGDVSLREPCKLRKFARAERRFLVDLLEGAAHLEDDFARRPERFKRLVRQLHPGDFGARAERLIAAADKLYNDALPPTTDSVFEGLVARRDPAVLAEVSARPGEMMRRLHHLVRVYGAPAARAFNGVLPKLTVLQLLKTERYLRKVNDRRFRTFPPHGDWANLQIVPADPSRRIAAEHLDELTAAIGAELRARLTRAVPTHAVKLSEGAKLVKIPTSDSQLAPYGRGTAFVMPEHVRFVRTAVYWSSGPTTGNVWYDNGWNFLDAEWKPLGACCWNLEKFGAGKNAGAVFSGDPTNSKDLEGRACQMIDLYPEKLVALGVRYAVWNVLCYSRVSFDDAKDVFAALQWGADPEKGKLFDPARCQLAFPLKGPQMTKYVAFVDLARRHVVYMDANLRANVSSAGANTQNLAKVMPAFVEYLESLPSVHDAFAHAPASETGMPVLYTDAGGPALQGGPAWVFRPGNEASRFEPFALEKILG